MTKGTYRDNPQILLSKQVNIAPPRILTYLPLLLFKRGFGRTAYID